MSLFLRVLLLMVMCISSNTNDTDNQSYIQLVPEFTEYTVDITMIRFILHNHGDTVYAYGTPREILKQEADGWRVIPLSGTLIATYLMPGTQHIVPIHLEDDFITLEEGIYTIEIVLYDLEGNPYPVSAEFSVVSTGQMNHPFVFL